MRAAVLWSGGKDSYLALWYGKKEYNVLLLVTFVPKNPSFKAHPLKLLELQAASLRIPLIQLQIDEPFQSGYVQAIKKLKADFDIDVLITGDIAPVDQMVNWIDECAREASVYVYKPLWQKDRSILLDTLIGLNATVIFSMVRVPYFDAQWVGRRITKELVTELEAIRKQNGLDLCGENGEYHTLVLNGPHFAYPLELRNMAHRTEGVMHYLIV